MDSMHDSPSTSAVNTSRGAATPAESADEAGRMESVSQPGSLITQEPAETAGPRYCRHCGSPWNPQWSQCPQCASQVYKTSTEHSGHYSRWPLKSALWLYFALLGTSGVLFLLVRAGFPTLTAELWVVGVDTVLVLTWLAVGSREAWKGLQRPTKNTWYLSAVLLGGVTFGIATLLTELLHHFFGLRILSFTDDYYDAGYGWLLPVLLVCLQPAIIEELAFRGVILTGLQHVLSAREAVVVSALMFMILHLSIPSGLHLFIIGLALGFLRIRSGSLYPGMLMHFTHNLLCTIYE